MSETESDKAVQSIPLDTEDGGTVVIEQQNVGSDNQVGGGEFKNTDRQKSSGEAAEEQAELEAEAPVDREGDGGTPAGGVTTTLD